MQNQSAFWAPLGITQSGGSRYENSRDIPTPVAMLIVLRESGKLTEDDLLAARAIVEETLRSKAE